MPTNDSSTPASEINGDGPRFADPPGQPCAKCGAPWSHDSEVVEMSRGVEARFRYWHCGRSSMVTVHDEGVEFPDVTPNACAHVAALRAERDELRSLLTHYAFSTTMEAHEWREHERRAREACGG